MTTVALRLPDSLHERVRQLAERDGTSVDQFVATAVTEKISAMLTEEYLRSRAQRGDRAAYDAVLAKAADAPPVRGDEL